SRTATSSSTPATSSPARPAPPASSTRRPRAPTASTCDDASRACDEHRGRLLMDLLLLATEATEAAEGGSGLSTVVVIVLIAALAAFAVAYVVVGPGKRKAGAKRRGDIPLAMRPYHSDEELETTGLERAMAWGVALSLFS